MSFSTDQSHGTWKGLYTVGHSNSDFSLFIRLLRDLHVELLVDVRSRPHSSRNPEFSQPGFQKLLDGEGISYLFLGEELGGRPDDPDAYRSNGLVDYCARRKSYAFGAGLERLVKELERCTAALMCAEEDPLECHRFLIICPELLKFGIQPLHIRKDSLVESQETAENRLLESNGFDSVAVDTLFPDARAEALEKAYALQAEKFAFRVQKLSAIQGIPSSGVWRKSPCPARSLGPVWTGAKNNPVNV